MIPALILLFFSALFLVWQGTLPLETGFALMAASVSTLLWKHLRHLQVMRRIRLETRERKAKWGGILKVVSGLSSFSGTDCYLFITRNDELIIEDVTGARIIPISEIARMVLVYGRVLEKQNDRQLMKQMGLWSIPKLSFVRAWIEKNPKARKRLFLVVRFQESLNDSEYSDMAVFSDLDVLGNLRTFALRPEAAVKTAVLPRRIRKTERTLKKVTAPVVDTRGPRDGR
ncbi:MAG: hypothetical protein WDA02_07410 [Saccharofermentanales bacterium]